MAPRRKHPFDAASMDEQLHRQQAAQLRLVERKRVVEAELLASVLALGHDVASLDTFRPGKFHGRCSKCGREVWLRMNGSHLNHSGLATTEKCEAASC